MLARVSFGLLFGSVDMVVVVLVVCCILIVRFCLSLMKMRNEKAGLFACSRCVELRERLSQNRG
jgi:hypothetical protein